MTSKEILQHIKNAPSFKGGDSRYMSTSNSAFLYDQDIKVIEKDLEVLEILKNKSSLISNEDSWLSLNIDKINMFKDEFDKIMEWLDNE